MRRRRILDVATLQRSHSHACHAGPPWPILVEAHMGIGNYRSPLELGSEGV